jgi:hypothetical protein
VAAVLNGLDGVDPGRDNRPRLARMRRRQQYDASPLQLPNDGSRT